MFLHKYAENEMCKGIKDRINIKNVAALYYLSYVFHFPRVFKPAFQLMERCFPMLVDSKSFLELGYKSVLKILSSSNLNIDSELEVFNAVVMWLSHLKERGKHAKNLLFTVRLSLLTISALKHVKCKYSSFIDDFTFIDNLISEKIKSPRVLDFKSQTRFSEQGKFDIMVCGGKYDNALRDAYSISSDNLKLVKTLPKMNERRKSCRVVCVKNKVYVLGGWDSLADRNWISSISKYSSSTNAWQTVARIPDERSKFCACSFMSDIFVLGGTLGSDQLSSCVKLNTASYAWEEVASMREVKDDASCAVFEGKLVVSGGFVNGVLDDVDGIRTVEAYDHVANTWTYMPNLVEERNQHKSCAVKNKLFIIAGSAWTCEVYSSHCNKFELLTCPKLRSRDGYWYVYGAIQLGRKLVLIFGDGKCLIYDYETDVWSENSIPLLDNRFSFSCAKMPQY